MQLESRDGRGSAKSSKRTRDKAGVTEEVVPAAKRRLVASGATLINGSEVNTPKVAQKH